MKRVPGLLIIALFFSTHIKAQKASWPEMDSFHTVMAQTFHPAEEGKMDPVRNRSAEIVTKATQWKKSTAPEGFDKTKVDASLTKLVAGARELDQLVQSKASDTVIRSKLSKLHDTFHEIMEKCEKEGQH